MTARADDAGMTFMDMALLVARWSWAAVFWLFIWAAMTSIFLPALGVVYAVALWLLGLSSRRAHLRAWAGLCWAYRKCFVIE